MWTASYRPAPHAAGVHEGAGRDPAPILHTPEQRLMLAVLAQAVEDFEALARGETPPAAYGPDERAAVGSRAALEGWFKSAEDAPLTFEWICDRVDIEPDFVRRKLGLLTRDDA